MEKGEDKKGGLAPERCDWRFRKLGGSANVVYLPERDFSITTASTESVDSFRGQDFALAHLSEVAFWRTSAMHDPNDFIRSVCGSILNEPGTLLVLESTANGVGNFFHREWLRAQRGGADKVAAFVPWTEIDIYRLDVADYEALWESLDDYELGLWNKGLTLEQLAWYHHKRKEYQLHSQMMAEYPTDAVEAFVSTTSGVFAPELVNALRRDVIEPVAVGELTGVSASGADALKGLRFSPDSRGCLRVWEFPVKGIAEEASQRYVVGVDIGGLSAGADWSVVTVMDCGLEPCYKPRIVAVWRGHIDHDLLAWKCAAIARWYGQALLVVESNTLECEHTDGDPSTYILNNIGKCYKNLYYRNDVMGASRVPGFHMNRATKSALITGMIAAVRDGTYIERDALACDELEQYERRPNGSYSARDGCHDDLLMTRALILGVLPERKVTPLHAVNRYVGN